MGGGERDNLEKGKQTVWGGGLEHLPCKEMLKHLESVHFEKRQLQGGSVTKDYA